LWQKKKKNQIKKLTIFCPNYFLIWGHVSLHPKTLSMGFFVLDFNLLIKTP
jgi:hypothetical protein